MPSQPRLLAALIFLVDLGEPLGSVLGMAYVPVILLGLWVRWGTYPLWAAAAATLLVIADTAAGWTPDVPRAVYTNRPLMIVLFWITQASWYGSRL